MQYLVGLMISCYEFLQYKFVVFGYSFSLFEITICCWSFDIVMDFIFKMFGGKEVD